MNKTKESDCGILYKIEAGEWQGRLVRQPDELTARQRFKDRLIGIVRRLPPLNRVRI